MDKRRIERAADMAKESALRQAYVHGVVSECEVSKLMLDTAQDREGLEQHIRAELSHKFGDIINKSKRFKIHSEGTDPYNHGYYPVIKNRMEAYIFTKEELTQVFDNLIHTITQELIKEGEHGTGSDNA